MTCPHCGEARPFGPAIVVDSRGVKHLYYDCRRCHTLLLLVAGRLLPRGGAW